jgi:hypothetical protein
MIAGRAYGWPTSRGFEHAMSDIESLTPEQRAAVPRLIGQSVAIADYGLGHDGCPFCARIVEHERGCVALVFGATSGRIDAGPGREASDQDRHDRP